jgi:hypothetical protein
VAVISGLFTAFRVGRKMWSDLRWALHIGWLGVRLRLRENWRNGVIRKILGGVCAEAAVLALIFPFLDVVVANNEISAAASSGTTAQFISVRGVLWWSLSFVALALFGAFILGGKEKEEER